MSNYTSTANVVLSVNGKQAQKVLASLEKDAARLERQLAAASGAADKATMKKLQRELNSTQRLMQQLRGSAASVEDTLKKLDSATPKELNKALKTLQQQLNGIERGSAAWDAQIEKIKAVKEELRKVNEAMRPDQGVIDRLNDWWEKWQNIVVGATAVVTGMVMAGRSAVNSYAEMEQEMANVRKFTGMGADEVERLNEELKKIDTRTSREDLNKLAQEAGRLGKTSQEDVLGFVRAADKINVALDDLGQGATLQLSKLTGIFGDEKRLGTEQSLLAVGSVINELSQNCSASAPYLAEFASRMGGVGSQAGMTVQQIMGFAAVLDSNNQKLEASSTALSQVMVRIYQEPQKYARVAGMDGERFAALVKKDMNAAMLEFLTTLSKAGKMDTLSPMFRDMGENGSRAISALATLAGKIDEVKAQQANANRAFAEAVSIDKEFDVQNNTVQAGLDKAKKSLNELSVSLGQKLQPVMSLCISSSTVALKVLSALVDFIVKYKTEVLTAVVAVAAYTVAINFMAIRTALATKATAALNAVTVIGSKLFPILQLAVVATTNAVKYFTNGLQVNHAMQVKWRAAMSAMKFAHWAGLIITVASAVYLLAKRWVDAKSKTDEFTKASREVATEAESSTAAQIQVLDKLYAKTQDQTIALNKRLAAVKRMREIYPDYFKDISNEAILAGKAADAYNALRTSIIESAKAKGRESRITKLEEEIQQLEEEKSAQQAEWLGKKRRLEVYHAAQPERLASDPEYIIATKVIETVDRKYLPLIADKRRAQNLLASQNADYEIQHGESGRPTPDPVPTFVPGGGDGDGSGGGASNADRFAAEKEWREKLEAKVRILYAKGECDYITHTETMNRIAIQYYDKLLERSDLSETERLQLEADREEARLKQREQFAARSVNEEERSYNERLAELKQFYIDGEISKEAYDIKIEEAEIEHQRKLVELAAEGSKERMQAEARLSQLLVSQMERRQAETQRKEKEYADLKSEFFGDNPQQRQAQLYATLTALQVVYDREIAAAADNAAEKLRIEEAFEKAKLTLKQRYGLLTEEDNRNFLSRWNEDAKKWLEGDVGKAVTGSVDTVVSGMSAIFSQVSSMMQADLEVQTAAINKRYEAEISAAEGNVYTVKRLEKRKEAEIAQVKNEANRKMFAMQVIQAVAQTATNALSAYGSAAAVPLVGYILAPIAAAMAVAAGAVQVAAIRKQAQASQAQGYAEGGFTRPGGKWEPAGVVHAGEWVASQKLVNNPRTRPLLEALDYAQRTNTIGSLSMEDVSRSITAPAVLASRGVAMPAPVVNVSPSVTVEQNAEYAATMRRLAERLDEPFVTVNTVTGDHGMQRAQSEYERLMQNKSPKSRR